MKWSISESKIAFRLKNNKGFTLIELIVVIIILALLIGTVYMFLLSSGNFSNKNIANADAHSQSRMIFEGLRKEIGTAKGLIIVGNSEPYSISSSGLGIDDKVYFVYQNVFSDRSLSGPIVPAFGALPVKNIFVSFSFDDSKPTVLKVRIQANNGFVLETQIVTNKSSSGGGIITRSPVTITQGNALIIKSALESNM